MNGAKRSLFSGGSLAAATAPSTEENGGPVKRLKQFLMGKKPEPEPEPVPAPEPVAEVEPKSIPESPLPPAEVAVEEEEKKDVEMEIKTAEVAPEPEPEPELKEEVATLTKHDSYASSLRAKIAAQNKVEAEAEEVPGTPPSVHEKEEAEEEDDDDADMLRALEKKEETKEDEEEESEEEEEDELEATFKLFTELTTEWKKETVDQDVIRDLVHNLHDEADWSVLTTDKMDAKAKIRFVWDWLIDRVVEEWTASALTEEEVAGLKNVELAWRQRKIQEGDVFLTTYEKLFKDCPEEISCFVAEIEENEPAPALTVAIIEERERARVPVNATLQAIKPARLLARLKQEAASLHAVEGIRYMEAFYLRYLRYVARALGLDGDSVCSSYRLVLSDAATLQQLHRMAMLFVEVLVLDARTELLQYEFEHPQAQETVELVASQLKST